MHPYNLHLISVGIKFRLSKVFCLENCKKLSKKTNCNFLQFFIDWFYAGRAVIILSLFIGCAYLFNYSPSLWSCAASGFLLGLAWQQLAFVGHDIGHHVVTHNQKSDDNLGIVFGNFLQGESGIPLR